MSFCPILPFACIEPWIFWVSGSNNSIPQRLNFVVTKFFSPGGTLTDLKRQASSRKCHPWFAPNLLERLDGYILWLKYGSCQISYRGMIHDPSISRGKDWVKTTKTTRHVTWYTSLVVLLSSWLWPNLQLHLWWHGTWHVPNPVDPYHARRWVKGKHTYVYII